MDVHQLNPPNLLIDLMSVYLLCIRREKKSLHRHHWLLLTRYITILREKIQTLEKTKIVTISQF